MNLILLSLAAFVLVAVVCALVAANVPQPPPVQPETQPENQSAIIGCEFDSNGHYSDL